MSRVGKQPISLPDKVSVKIGADRSVLVEGPKGKLNWTLPVGVNVATSSSSAASVESVGGSLVGSPPAAACFPAWKPRSAVVR